MKKNKFVIVGVESTGKSTCAKNVAEHFNAILVDEYAREYLETHGNAYEYNDFLKIAKGQLQKEDRAENISGDRNIIFDTDFIVIYIWAKIVFGVVEQWIIDRLAKYNDRVYFLMSPEVEWVSDGLREYPDLTLRKNIHSQYIDILNELYFEYYIIEGDDHQKRQSDVIGKIMTMI